MKAVGTYLIIEEVIENITVTAGGLELAEKHRDDIRYKRGIVISSGPKEIKENDQILYDKIAGHNIDHNGIIYKVIQLRDIVAVL